MKKYIYKNLLASCLIFVSYTAHAVNKLEFPTYNHSETQTYKVFIKNYYSISGNRTRHDQAEVILKPGEKFSYSKSHSGGIGLEVIDVTNLNDPQKVAHFNKKKKDNYLARKVIITDNSDGTPHIEVSEDKLQQTVSSTAFIFGS
jgi:hypothetical protein